MGDPADLPHQLDGDAFTVRAIIETPAGSRAKLTLDKESGLYSVGKLLPLGLAMPLDFGFIPSTKGGDGDALDIMILSEAALPTGCLAVVRMIGAIAVEQRDRGSSKGPERNDRVIARLSESKQWAHIDRLEQLGEDLVTELNRFFEFYKDLRGQTYEVLDVVGPQAAVDLVRKWAR